MTDKFDPTNTADLKELWSRTPGHRPSAREAYRDLKLVEAALGRSMDDLIEQMKAEIPGAIFTSFGGNCPVQAEGFVDEQPFYFRARHEHWRMEIGGEPVVKPDWKYEEEYPGGQFEAGWMEPDEAFGFMAKAIEKWRKDQ